MQGKVKMWFANKGYGFISQEGKKDVFVHCQDIRRDGTMVNGKKLIIGQTVEFDIEETNQGPRATCVIVLKNK
jgi:CspA family cold shock protein